ncbi:MAG: hypothetical protein E3J91_01910 [Hadesarchaea archaeon]|nr:MAG: hypothetical protein E3J91_01910 [Hadesarchaea archaeon]
MKDKIALVIAALMMTSMAFAISTTSVSATHTPTATIDKDTVKGAATMVLTVTVQNAGPDPIDNVRIVFPSWSPASVVSIPKDNLVDISGLTENLVIIPAGTVIALDNDNEVWLYENTEVIGLVGSYLFRERGGLPDNSDNVKLVENVRMQIRDENFVYLTENENVAGVGTLEVTLDNGLVRLAEDTLAVRIDSENVWFPNGATVEVVAGRLGTTQEDNEEITLPTTVTVKIPAVENRFLRLLESVPAEFVDGVLAGVSTTLYPSTDENLTIYADNELAIPADTTVFIKTGSIVKLAENTEVTRPAENRAKMEDSAAAENRPVNWTQENTATYLAWAGIGENQIASGGSLDFPFAITTPDEGGEYTLYVRTKDTKGVIRIREVTLTVDNVLPEVEIDVSPDWVKGGTTVTITVTAGETLAKLDNVMVAENLAPENTQVTMTPNADKTVWTGTYTTGDNENRDGTANIYVFGFEDLLGNEGTETTATFTVDRMAPPTPVLDEITGFPDNQTTNVGEWLLENYALDNFLGELETQKGMTVEIRVGDTIYTKTTADSGYWYYQLTLPEGTYEVGIRLVDKAGNEGLENAENITYDATKPSISITSPADGAIINDNTPAITLTIADAVMGIENEAFDTDNSGFEVLLRRDNDNTVLATLTAVTPPTSDPFTSFTFDNQWQTDNALPEMWYNIFVQAGDNLQQENVYFRFKVDVTAPTVPTPATGENPLSGTTVISPLVQKSATLTLVGTGAEAGTTVKVYLDGATTAATTTTVDSTGRWTVEISLTAGATTEVEVTLTDVAGNEGARYLYGYVMADGTAPTVTLTTLPETTDKSSITISGTITKDGWEDWSDITLTVQVGTGRVVVPIGAGGSYSYSLALSEGPNTIVVQASDVIGNASVAATSTVERVVTPWSIYAIILVIVALILAAIAIFGGPRIWKR